MIEIAVSGAFGRMGSTVARLVNEADDLRFVGGTDISGGECYGSPVYPAKDIEQFLIETEPDVLIDFTNADASLENIRSAVKARTALVVGTTGFSDAQRDEIRSLVSGTVPAVISSNFSVGVNIFWNLIRSAVHLLPDYDIEVIEAHHRFKKDSPSGTAKTILDIIDEELGPKKRVYGREGPGERGDEVGVHSIRGGDIVGDHTVLFAGNFECIELSHRAYDRAVFAKGAIKAARWVIGQKPGVYTMNDVLGL
ncbi:MAG: 4-hydroxy-tetrahydrodipicolinate reductase [Methanoculleaceae archaeon]